MDSRAIVADIVAHSGMPKARLSAASGVSRSLIDDYLKGRSQPTLPQLERLARVAGLTLTVNVEPVRKVPEEFIAVLEFGELFPHKGPKPLVNLAPVWRQARERA